MEIEINKLKLEYDKITPPAYLTENGVNDMWSRVDAKSNHSNLYYGKFIFAGLLLFIVITSGIITIASANAEPGSTFYPVKTLTYKATDLISNKQKTEEVKVLRNTKPKPKKTITPAPSITPKVEIKTEENKLQNSNQNENKSSTKTKPDEIKNSIEIKQEVKGANTVNNSKNGNTNNSNNTNENSNKEKGQSNNPSSNPGKGSEMSEVHKKDK